MKTFVESNLQSMSLAHFLLRYKTCSNIRASFKSAFC